MFSITLMWTLKREREREWKMTRKEDRDRGRGGRGSSVSDKAHSVQVPAGQTHYSALLCAPESSVLKAGLDGTFLRPSNVEQTRCKETRSPCWWRAVRGQVTPTCGCCLTSFLEGCLDTVLGLAGSLLLFGVH